MIEVVKFQYKDDKILMYANSGSNGDPSIDIFDAKIYINGVEAKTNAGWSKLKFQLTDGSIGALTINQPFFKHLPAEEYCKITVNGEELTPVHNQFTRTLSYENLAKLASYPAITAITPETFIAVKGMASDNVFKLKSDTRVLLYVGDGPITDEMVRDLKNYKLSTPLISVHPHNLRPGDNVLVLPGIGLGFKEPAPIIVNNISTIMRHHDGWNSSFSLEGEDISLTTLNTKKMERAITKEMEEIGLSVEDLTAVINSTTTYAELVAIQTLFEQDIQITDVMLQELADGKDVREIVERETMFREDIDMVDQEHDVCETHEISY